MSKPVTPTFYQSKAALLLKDIISEDSLTRKEARRFLGHYKFEKQDLELLHAAVSRSYDDDTSSMTFYRVRKQLFEAIEGLNENASYGFIEKIYPGLDSLPELQVEALKVLLYSKSKDGYAVFEKLTADKLPDNQYSYNLFRALSDSLELNTEFLPKVFKYITYPGYRSDLLYLASTLIDSSKINPSFFEPYEKIMIDLFKKDLADLTVDNIEHQYMLEENLTSAAELMKNFPENTSYISLLEELSKHKNCNVAIEAVKLLLSISKKG
ncbi:MAG: hypothetical protein NVV82_19550 [Sporocytophaga sp.]|nr:hypothetical protein [Sporocytophaga sp.]